MYNSTYGNPYVVHANNSEFTVPYWGIAIYRANNLQVLHISRWGLFWKKKKNTTTLPLMCLCFFTTQPLYSLGHISKASPKDMDTCTRPVCRLWGQCIHSLIQQAWWVLDLITNFVWQATLSTIVKILKYEWIGPWALQLEYLTVPVLIVSDSPNVGEVLSD